MQILPHIQVYGFIWTALHTKGDLKELYIADKTLQKEGRKDTRDIY